MSKEFGLVGGHVHIDGAFAFAGLAGKAEIERFFYIFVFPAALKRIAAQHFKEQARTAAGGVLLFPGDHVAGAHGAAIVFTALAYADAADGSLRKVPVVFRKSEISFDWCRTICCTEAQVFVEWVGVNFFARIHLPAGVPDALEFAECLHQLGTKHSDEQFAAGLAVTMLTG